MSSSPVPKFNSQIVAQGIAQIVYGLPFIILSATIAIHNYIYVFSPAKVMAETIAKRGCERAATAMPVLNSACMKIEPLPAPGAQQMVDDINKSQKPLPNTMTAQEAQKTINSLLR